MDGVKEMLTKEQMKMITGGYTGFTCYVELSGSFECGGSPGYGWPCNDSVDLCWGTASNACSAWGGCCTGFGCGAAGV